MNDLTLGPMPWWVSLICALVSGLGGHLATRMTSKDKVQSNLVAQTVKRQEQLDERQNQMMDDLSGEIVRVRDELLLVRKELNTERTHSRVLSTEMEAIKAENRKLSAEMEVVKAENKKLKAELQKFQTRDRSCTPCVNHQNV